LEALNIHDQLPLSTHRSTLYTATPLYCGWRGPQEKNML